MKRIISLALVLAMLTGVFPINVFAMEDTSGTQIAESAVTEVSEETVEAETTETTGEEIDVPESSEPAQAEDEAAVAHEHEYATTVTAPTCSEKGFTTYTCSCGDSYVADYTNPRGYEWMLEDGEFKILLIGNSFSEDASNAGMPNSQMLDILQAMLGEDVSVTVGLCYNGGKGLNWHATQSEQGSSSYSLRVISTESGSWKNYGSYTSAKALTFTDWDVVTL